MKEIAASTAGWGWCLAEHVVTAASVCCSPDLAEHTKRQVTEGCCERGTSVHHQVVRQRPMFNRVNHSQAVRGIISTTCSKQASENAFSELTVRFISLTPNLLHPGTLVVQVNMLYNRPLDECLNHGMWQGILAQSCRQPQACCCQLPALGCCCPRPAAVSRQPQACCCQPPALGCCCQPAKPFMKLDSASWFGSGTSPVWSLVPAPAGSRAK